MTKLGTLSSYQNTYSAYAGPEIGGFGLVPPENVPKMGVSDESRQMLIGNEGMGPSWYAGTNPNALPLGDLMPTPKEGGGATKLGTLSAYNQQVATPPASVTTPQAASTVAPKGGTPYQPNVLVDQALEDFRKLMQPISRREQAVKEQRAEDRSALGNVVQSHVTGVGNAIMHTPSVIADVLTYPDRRRQSIDRGERPGEEPVFGATPRYGVEDVGAVLGSLKQATGGQGPTREQARENIAINEAARREAYPNASTIGDLTGAVETLAALRSPFIDRLRAFEYGTTKQINKGQTLYEMAPYADRAARSKVLMQSPGFNALLRGAGRTAEAGLEGTALALLEDKDPATAAAFSAGTQGLVSAGTEGLMRKFTKLPSRVATLAVNGAILTGAIYGLGVLAPGEIKDYEAQKAATHKIILGYTLGAGLSLFGARARSGANSVDFPRLTDALASAPRNMMQKIMIDYLNSDETKRMELKGKLTSMYNNLDKFSEGQLRDLSAAFNSSTERFYNELDKATKELPQ
jgi:hypothetical protein